MGRIFLLSADAVCCEAVAVTCDLYMAGANDRHRFAYTANLGQHLEGRRIKFDFENNCRIRRAKVHNFDSSGLYVLGVLEYFCGEGDPIADNHCSSSKLGSDLMSGVQAIGFLGPRSPLNTPHCPPLSTNNRNRKHLEPSAIDRPAREHGPR